MIVGSWPTAIAGFTDMCHRIQSMTILKNEEGCKVIRFIINLAHFTHMMAAEQQICTIKKIIIQIATSGCFK